MEVSCKVIEQFRHGCKFRKTVNSCNDVELTQRTILHSRSEQMHLRLCLETIEQFVLDY